LNRLIPVVLAAAALTAAAPAVLFAQTAKTDAAAEAPIHLGPLAIQPTIDLQNVGVDTNPMNLSQGAQSDFTATFVPGAIAWLRIGRAQLISHSSAELVYFGKTTTQRSVGFGQSLRLEGDLARLTPFVEGTHATTFQRPNAEIDVRVRQTTNAVTAGSALEPFARLGFDVEMHTSQLDFGAGTIAGIGLAAQLNRRITGGSVDARYALTPLTSLVVRAGLERNHFPAAPVRDARSFSVTSGLAIRPLALLSGSAMVGYERFRPDSPDLPGFTGLVAAVKAAYLVRDLTQLGVTFNRNVDYSYEPGEPYFVVTGGVLTLTQIIGGAWDAVGRAGGSSLRYQLVGAAAGPAADPRVDRTTTLGFGIGYHLTFGARVGFNVDYSRRRSPLAEHQYRGFRFGGVFSYGS
jgi:Putative beta-barrel porin 2